jgi:cell division protein FtsZ
MGGGTGTGAAPVIAKAARDRGILTVGVVTKPFSFEGSRRMKSAEAGIAELQKHVDTLIVIPNQNLFLIANPSTTFKEAFAMADEVLQQGVRGITDLMVMPGLINLDFADVRSVMGEMGKAMMGTGEADGDNRAIEAAQKAIANPLLDGVSMRGAKGVIISITGGEDMRLMEVDEAASHIKELVDPDANIIWGSAFNNDMGGKIRVSVVATGIEADAAIAPEPARVFSFPTARKNEEIIRTPEPVIAPAPIVETVEEVAEVHVEAPAPEPVMIYEEPSIEEAVAVQPDAEIEEEAPLVLDAPVAAEAEVVANADDDAFELDVGSMLAEEVGSNPVPPEAEVEEAFQPQKRRWLVSNEKEEETVEPAPRVAPASGGTLFERMSNIARGAAKADSDPTSTDPLDIPRFLNRQNNQ